MAKRKKHPRLPNSFGSIRYISGGRRNPYAVHPPCKETDDFGRPIRPKALCYVDDWYVGFAVLSAYHAGTYKSGDELELRTFKQQSTGRDLDVFCQKIIDNFAASRSAEVRNMRTGKTFAEVFEDFFEWKFSSGKKLSSSSQKAMKSAFNNCKTLHDRFFVDLKYPDLQHCVDDCQLRYSSKTNIVLLIKQMYKYAILFEICEKDYATHLSTNMENDAEHGEAFTDEELKILWDNKNDPVVQLLLIMCYSGFRISAYNTLEINLEEKYFKGGIKTASSKDRIVPIHSAIYEMVKERCSEYSEYFIGYKTTFNLRKNLKECFDRLGIKQHTPHDCRHTFSSLCEKYEVNENDRKRLLGHSFGTDITNKVYGHRTIEELREQIEKIKVVV